MKKLFVLGIAALLVCALALPVMAETKVGGIVFTDFYYYARTKRWSQTNPDHITADATSGLTKIEIPSITRLYARWTNEDNVGAYIEFGIGGAVSGSTGEYTTDNNVHVRHAYGWWNITPQFELMAGHSTTPFSPLNPDQLVGTNSGGLHIIGVGYGEFYSGRYPQVRGTYKFNENVRLAVALVDPSQKVANFDALLAPKPGTSVDAKTKLPRFEFGLPIYVGPVKIYPGAFWEQKEYDDVADGYPTKVTAWGGSIGFNLGVGPFGLAAEGQYGQNWGNTGGLIGNAGSPNNTAYWSAARLKVNSDGTRSTDDTKAYGWWLDASFRFGVATPHLMYGMQNVKGSDNPMNITSQMYGISLPIQAAKGFTIRPELMWYQNGNRETLPDGTTANMGSEQIYGIQFQITF